MLCRWKRWQPMIWSLYRQIRITKQRIIQLAIIGAVLFFIAGCGKNCAAAGSSPSAAEILIKADAVRGSQSATLTTDYSEEITRQLNRQKEKVDNLKAELNAAQNEGQSTDAVNDLKDEHQIAVKKYDRMIANIRKIS